MRPIGGLILVWPFSSGGLDGLNRRLFDDLPDPRTGNAARHNLLAVLTIALTASICRAESVADVADFGRDRAALFAEFVDLSAGLPSPDTFARLFRLLDPARFARCFGLFLDQLGEAGAGVQVIDGKTLRRSFDAAAGQSPLHVVTAFACERRLVLAQAAVNAPCAAKCDSPVPWPQTSSRAMLRSARVGTAFGAA